MAVHFPRSLAPAELEFVRWILPTECEVYRTALERIENDIVIGEGRWGHGDLMLGRQGAELDLSLGMAPVVAFGECQTASGTVTVSVHEPNADDLVEVQFSGVWPITADIQVTSGWTYSYWKPGMACPATGGHVREVSLFNTHHRVEYTLAISTSKRVLWLHHHGSGFNQLVPVTGFADEVFRTHEIRDAAMVTHPATLFTRLQEFSDDDLRHAILEYNTIASRRFDASRIGVPMQYRKRAPFGGLFGKKQ